MKQFSGNQGKGKRGLRSLGTRLNKLAEKKKVTTAPGLAEEGK